jgi:cysteine desulfurase
VVRVTGNFTSENPLSEIVSKAISAAFEAGWADPKKLSQASQRAKILQNQALEALASGLGIRVDQMEIVGESELATYLCIAGFLDPSRHLSVGAIDRGKIRAFTRTHQNHSIVPVDQNGYLDTSQITADSILSLQISNGETGIRQDIDLLATKAQTVVLDATYSGSRIALGDRWDGAIFSSHAWGGPTGISIMAIANSQQWRYPLPHIAPIRTPGGYSLPLLLGAAVALENFAEDHVKIDSLNLYLRQKIASALPTAIVVGANSERLSNYQTIIVPGTVSEMLVRELEASSISIDAGSACSPADLVPSHVLAAMGLPTEGSIRITLRQDHSERDIDSFVSALVEVCRNF